MTKAGLFFLTAVYYGVKSLPSGSNSGLGLENIAAMADIL
jgi:hypothetical protein